TRSGGLFAAVHLEAYVPRISVCAEAIAIGMAAAAGDTAIDTIVAVNRRGEVISPCGMCRELIADYSPGARVIVPRGRGEEVTSIAALLPNKYRRRPPRAGASSSGATGASTSRARRSARAR
ncbi:MAG: hypothetical protein HY323_18955, partial [Betaproteobacteria bacterium]|nr:hypothetical protein [Betaproteobacteria bacterium]